MAMHSGWQPVDEPDDRIDGGGVVEDVSVIQDDQHRVAVAGSPRRLGTAVVVPLDPG